MVRLKSVTVSGEIALLSCLLQQVYLTITVTNISTKSIKLSRSQFLCDLGTGSDETIMLLQVIGVIRVHVAEWYS